jgi:hypothetical protein
MNTRSTDFIEDFEQAFCALVIYLISATGEENLDCSIESYEKFYAKHIKDQSIQQITAAALNRIDRLKIKSGAPSNNN